MEPSTDTTAIDLLSRIPAGSLEASSLDPKTLMLVRIAALAAADAPPASYWVNLTAPDGLQEKDVWDVLAAIAPIVGPARITTATGDLVRSLGVGTEITEFSNDEV